MGEFSTEREHSDLVKMELYLKAGADGQSVGDCPFAHYVRAVLAYKDLPCSVHPCGPSGKPSWLVESHGGKMPCLKTKDDIITESSVIADHINSSHPPILPTGEDVKAEVGGIFPAMARLVKSTQADPSLEEAFVLAVTRLANVLKSSGGPWLLGDSISLADLALGPVLYHASITLAEWHPGALQKMEGLEVVAAYRDRLLALPCVRDTSYPRETVLWGWGQARAK